MVCVVVKANSGLSATSKSLLPIGVHQGVKEHLNIVYYFSYYTEVKCYPLSFTLGGDLDGRLSDGLCCRWARHST